VKGSKRVQTGIQTIQRGYDPYFSLEPIRTDPSAHVFSPVWPKYTEYVLRTGTQRAGPIKEFELVIRKSSPTQLVSTCFSAPLHSE
jgi:hypothetical protein